MIPTPIRHRLSTLGTGYPTSLESLVGETCIGFEHHSHNITTLMFMSGTVIQTTQNLSPCRCPQSPIDFTPLLFTPIIKTKEKPRFQSCSCSQWDHKSLITQNSTVDLRWRKVIPTNTQDNVALMAYPPYSPLTAHEQTALLAKASLFHTKTNPLDLLF